MLKDSKISKETIRVSGKLKEILTIHDSKGNLLHKIVSPLMVEFYARDIIQVIVGSTLLAIPMAFTEETWKLGEMLPMSKILSLMAFSLFFISVFVYYNFYRQENFANHWDDFLKRVFSTYLISFVVVAIILTLIEKAPWSTDHLLAIKRVILVAFPASMSAAVADMIK